MGLSEQIAACHAKGMTVQEATVEIGCQRATVNKWAKDNGQSFATRSSRFRAVLADCQKEGLTANEAAEKAGCTLRTAHLWAKENGVSFVKPDRPMGLPNTKQFREMWRGPMTSDEIAAHFGVSGSQVKRAARAYGYPPRGLNTRRARPPEKPKVAGPKSKETELSPRFGGAEMAARIMKTKGSHRALSDLATEMGWTHAKVQAAWHQVRSGQ